MTTIIQYELFAARITGEEKGLASQEGEDIGNGGGGMGWGTLY
jgi:hypothetical protein